MKNSKLLLAVVFIAFVAGVFGGFLWARIVSPEILVSGDGATVIEEHVFIEESEVIDTIDEVSPAVVSLVLTQDVSSFSEFDFGSREIAGGTGFIVSSDGLILTNKHVLGGEDVNYSVVLNNGTEYFVEVVSVDPFDDVAVLRIVPSDGEILDLPIVVFGDSDNLRVGQKVLAIGNALALYGNTVTSGIVSAKEREILAYNDVGTMGENLSGLIQTDAAINLGNSGGPLVNLNGEVVGMNVAVAELANGIGFAIPINDLKPVVESIKEYGEIIRPVLGVRFVMLTEKQAEELDVDLDHGAILISGEFVGEPAISPRGAGYEAGLREMDIVLEVNGIKIDLENPLHKVVRKYNPGDEIVMKVWREGKEIEVTVVLKSNKDL